MDVRAPRDGKVIEELGYYDPLVKDENARAILKGERIDYWLGVGAQPSEKVQVLIKKYGTNGTHLSQQQAALAAAEDAASRRRRRRWSCRSPKKAEPAAGGGRGSARRAWSPSGEGDASSE